MPATETRPVAKPRPAQLRDPELHTVPALLLELEDERTRARKRESALISIVVHLVLLIALILSPKFRPQYKIAAAVSSRQLLNDHELTFMELAPDKQKATPPRNTNIISDKDRVATSRAPVLHPRELRKILEASAPGAPAASPAPSTPSSAAQAAAAGKQGQTPAPANQLAQLGPAASRPGGGIFSAPLSPSASLEQATRAAAANRGGLGSGGDYGLGGLRPQSQLQSDFDVLSDTRGVDFSEYFRRIRYELRTHWYNSIPEIARPPIMKKGKVTFEFDIQKDGHITGVTMIGTSGDASLDRGALSGITASNPFPPLPLEFPGEHLLLRAHFYYNPDVNDLR